MPEVARATITVTPVMPGAQQTITKDLTDAAQPAGAAAGKAAGASMSEAISKKMNSAGSDHCGRRGFRRRMAGRGRRS